MKGLCTGTTAPAEASADIDEIVDAIKRASFGLDRIEEKQVEIFREFLTQQSPDVSFSVGDVACLHPDDAGRLGLPDCLSFIKISPLVRPGEIVILGAGARGPADMARLAW